MKNSIQERYKNLFAPYKSIHLHSHVTLYEPEAEVAKVSFLIQGQVKQYVVTPLGEEVVVHVYRQPAVVPMMVLFSGIENRYYFETVSDVHLKQAPAAKIVKTIKSDAELMADFTARFAMAIDGLSQRLISVTGTRQKDQLYSLLQYLARKQGKEVEAGKFLVEDQTHADLAAWLGSARETVSRLLKQLESDNLIEYRHRKIKVLPW